MVHMVGTVVTMRSRKVGMVGMTLAVVVIMVMSTPSRRRGVTVRRRGVMVSLKGVTVSRRVVMVSLKEVTTSHRAGMVSRRRAGMTTVSNRAGMMRTVGMVGMGMGTLLVVVGCVMCRDIPLSRMAVTLRSTRVMLRHLSTRVMLERLRTRIIVPRLSMRVVRRRLSTQRMLQHLNTPTPQHLNTRTTRHLNTRTTTQLPLQTLPLQHRHQSRWRRRTFVLRSWKS